jgi:hypothetical protein
MASGINEHTDAPEPPSGIIRRSQHLNLGSLGLGNKFVTRKALPRSPRFAPKLPQAHLSRLVRPFHDARSNKIHLANASPAGKHLLPGSPTAKSLE